MLSKAQIKNINALKIKKYRQKEGLFIAEGSRCVRELLQTELPVTGIYALQQWLDNNAVLLKGTKAAVYAIGESELQKISNLSTSNEVLITMQIPRYEPDPAILTNALSLVLDDINDPGNMGTIIRIADWFGISHIFCSPDTAEAYNPKVVQASMGSIGRVRIIYGQLDRLFERYDQLPVVGAVLDGKNIFNAELAPKGFLLIGNEARGIAPELSPYIRHRVTIPALGKAESLNAAVATGILCSHLLTN